MAERIPPPPRDPRPRLHFAVPSLTFVARLPHVPVWLRLLVAFSLTVWFLPSNLGPSEGDPAAGLEDGAVARVPLTFEENVGQTDEVVDFVARGRGYQVFLTEGDAGSPCGSTWSAATRPRR